MALSLLSISAATPPLASPSHGSSTRSASLVNVHRVPAAAPSCSLRSSFLSTPSTSLSFQSSSSFAGLSLGLVFGHGEVLTPRHRVFQVRASKAALCQTKRNRSRKSLARTHGFRRRMRTTRGRAILKRRRAKGRKVLCTKTNPNSGKRA